MARRGSFGRSPRPAASLTNTILAIAQEMQSQRDRNLMAAWEKGGDFEGKKVTDELILAHWKDRAANVDKSDPDYDKYQNAYMEYDFAISESKISTAYAQGKITDSQAAAFYLNWSKKVPKNSEFWRVLQRDAAQFLRAAKAKGKAAAAAAKEKAYQDSLADIHKKKIAPGAYITEVLTNLAKRGLRPGGGDPLIDPVGGKLYHFQPDDVTEMLRLIGGGAYDAGWQGQESIASSTVLYNDPVTGKPVTGQTIAAELKRLDPSFSGVFDAATVNSYLTRQRDGQILSAEAGEKTGHLSDAKGFRSDVDVTSEVSRQIGAMPVMNAYLESRARMLAVTTDPSSSEFEIVDAVGKHRSNISIYLKDKSIAKNDVLINKFNAELRGDEGVSTAAEDFSGLYQVEPRDTSRANAAVDRAIDSIQAVESGAAVWATGSWQDGVFVPSAGGATIGAVDRQTLANYTTSAPARTLFVTDKSGRAMPVHIPGKEIIVKAIDPVTGKELAPKGNPVFGHIFTGPDGKQVVSYKDGQGKDLFSALDDAPWGNSARLTETAGQDGVFTLLLSTPTGDLANTGFEQVAGPKNTTVVVFNPYAATLATDREHENAIWNNGDPATDFRSFNLAYYANDLPRAGTLATLSRREEFSQAVEDESRVATGMSTQYDAKGNFLGWAGDSAQYDRSTRQTINALEPRGALVGFHDAGDRSTPAANLRPDERYERSIFALPPDGTLTYANPVKPLATSNLGLGWAALGGVYAAGTLNLNQAAEGVKGSLSGSSISLSGVNIKTPGFTPSEITSQPIGKPPASSFGPSGAGLTMPGPTINSSTGFTMPVPPPPRTSQYSRLTPI